MKMVAFLLALTWAVLGDGFLGASTSSAAGQKRELAPQPIPIDIAYTLGAYYMPKPREPSHQWTELKLHNQNNFIKLDGQRLPLLGYYQGDSPEVLDWQIKFAVDHGITYFVFDDYWTESQSTPTYEGSLNAFLHARFRRYMQFAVTLYANTTIEDTADARRKNFLEKILPYYVSHYFNQPNYLLVDKKPAIYIGGLDRLGADVPKALAEADVYIRAHSPFPGGYWIAGQLGMTSDRVINFGHVKWCGFSAVSPYYVLPWLYPRATADPAGHGPRWPIEVKPDPNCRWGPGLPYAQAVSTAIEQHAVSFQAAAACGMKFIPSITTDFDSRWVWFQADHVYFSGQNREGYCRELAAVRKLVDENAAAVAIATRTGKPMVGLGAWNEEAESSSIEPGYAAMQVHGSNDPFSAVTAIARAFGGPANYPHPIPPDYGLGWPMTSQWTFHTAGGQGLEQWQADGLRVEAGDVGGLTIDGPRGLLIAATGVSTSNYRQLKVQMNIDQGGPLKEFLLRWQSSDYSDKADSFRAGPEPGRKVHDSLMPAEKQTSTVGDFTEYTFNLRGRADWSGKLGSIELRIRPTARPAHVQIKKIWLVP